MIPKEQIAHDLALLWVQNVLDEKVEPLTADKGIIDEYVAAYRDVLEKLQTRKDINHVTGETSCP